MTEIRCKKCNRLLLKADIIKGEIKCPKCTYLNKIEGYSKIGRDYLLTQLTNFMVLHKI